MNDNSLTAQLENVNLYHANIVKLANGYMQALTTQESEISVALENKDGGITNVLIPSNIALSNKLQRLLQSFDNLSGLTENQSALVAQDGSFREIFVTSHRKSLPSVMASDIDMASDVKLSTNTIIESLLSPLTEVELTLSADYQKTRQTRVTKLFVTDGDMSTFSDGMSYSEAKRILATGDFVWTEQEYDKLNQATQARYSGDFNVTSSVATANDTVLVTLESLRYNDSLNVVEQSKRLDVGDALTTKDGSVRISIQSINAKSDVLTCIYDAGIGSILTGEAQLSILSTEESKAIIRIPVRLKEQSIIFISPINDQTGFASSKSTAKLFIADNFTVVQAGETFRFNEFFSSKVADVGRYFESIVRESLIPANLGQTPTKPTLIAQDFEVVQINAHLTNSPTTEKLRKIQKEKDVITSQIEVLNSSIFTLTSKIAQGNYSTVSKRENDVSKRTAIINDKMQKTSLLGSLVGDINTLLKNTSEQASISPKYRVRGFWPIQRDIPSDITDPQKIVQYQARFRYVSNVGNSANATQLVYTDGENKVSASFTPWTTVKTEPLNRVVDKDGNSKWSINSPSDSDQSNINQLDVAIQYGESVEFQVKAMSEAGWPVAPVMSDWSDLVRVDFPVELLQESDTAAIARKNTEDALTVRVQQEFNNQGITEHLAGSFREQEKFFAHEAKRIASGYVTNEQTTISMFEYTSLLENRIKLLEELVDRRYATVSVQLVDEDLRTYDVNNFSTVKLFAGYYTEEVDLTEQSNWGSIVTKQFYLRLMNRNAQTVELLSITPGSLNQNVDNAAYDKSALLISGSNEVIDQKQGQIFYNRATNINGDADLYLATGGESSTLVSPADIDTTAVDSAKNVIQLDGGLVENFKLLSSAALNGYVAMTNLHPAYLEYRAQQDITILQTEFDRIKHFNSLYREVMVQNAKSNDLIIGFKQDDKYLVGQNTVGAAAYVDLNSLSSYQVEGIDSSASKQIFSGEQDSILIPIMFQYRMTDALGNPSGVSGNTMNSQFEYTKKIGFDLLISGKKFTFDVNINAKFRPTTASNTSLGIQPTTSINATQANII